MTADELYLQAFRAEIAALKPASLCDVGCGAGTLLAFAQSLGIAATGIEPDAAKVAEANGRGLDIRVGAAEALPFPDGAYDLVTFENSLHHVTEIGRALAEAMRVARRAVVTPGVGAPGVGVRPGTLMNRGGPVNRVGRR